MVLKFSFYLKKGFVKKVQRDINRKNALLNMARKRIEYSKKLDDPNFKLEFIYEALIEYIEAIMAEKGYKSYSHEADISFLRELGFKESEIARMDEIRRLRHKSKYYGEVIKKEIVEDIEKFILSLIEKLESLV